MKKPEWLFVGILLLLGVYFTYKYFSKPEKFDPLQLVPNSSVAVYETRNIIDVYNSLKNAEYWQDILSIEELSDANRIIMAADSLIAKNKQIAKQLRTNKTLFSVHVTGNESVGLMIYLPTGAATRKLFDVAFLELFNTQPVHTARVYETVTIHELSADDTHIAYIFFKDYAIVSTISYLVEDVVRNLNNEFTNNFIANNPELLKVPKLNDDTGNLFINGTQLSALYSTLLPALHSDVGVLAKSMFMDLSMVKNQALFSGFLFDDKKTEFAALFRDQEAGFPTTIRFVPDNAAVAMSINVSDVSAWYNLWITRYGLANSANTQNSEFVQNISGDISLATFSSNDKTKQDKLLLIKLADKEGMLNVLNKQAEEIALANGDSVYFEQYATYKIGLIEKDEFVSSILGSPFSGFHATYFMIYNEFLILASSAERIKKWIQDIDNDYVWGRSAETRSFIDENLGEISFALVFNNPWNWSLSLDTFNSKHRQWWLKNEKTIKQFGLAAYQFTNLDNKFYTAASLSYQPLKIESGHQKLHDELLAQLAYKLIHKPKLVKNHHDGSWEILVQDSTNQISLLDTDGEIVWLDSLTGPVISKVYQIDYFKNNKLQYLFATDSSIYIIDRNGDTIDNFPVHFTEFKVEELYLLDYDHSKNYRFLIADNTGNLRMFNQKMEPLDGWSPLAFNTTLSDQVFHVRVRGKDRIVVAQENGIIDLRNRRAEEQPGFPVELEFNIANPLHFKVGSTFAGARFTTLSKEGLIASFDLTGKMYGQIQLYQATSSSAFKLVIDPVQNDYIFSRQDLNRLTILDKEGEILFEKDFQTNAEKDIQYYSLGVDKQLFIIRDLETGSFKMYNKNGTLINSDNLQSAYPISVIYRKSKSKCYIYVANKQLIQVKSFPF